MKNLLSVHSTYRLQGLLDFRVQGTRLDGDDLGSGLGVMSNGRAAIGAEDPMDRMTRGALSSPALDWALDGQLGLGHDSDEG